MSKVLSMISLFTFVFTSTLWAADVSGTWTLKMAAQLKEVSMDLALRAAGENLTITGKHPVFGDMTGIGTLKGNAIDMSLASTGERKVQIQFKGTVTDNKMEGTRELKMISSTVPVPGIRSSAPIGDTNAGAPAAGGQINAPVQAVPDAWTAEKK
jgi:hypothetical protein